MKTITLTEDTIDAILEALSLSEGAQSEALAEFCEELQRAESFP